MSCVEAICEQGCSAVRAVIAAMEEGFYPVQTEGLSETQRRFVLEELKAIMAVYNRPCPVPAIAPRPVEQPPRRAYARASRIA